MDVFYTPDFNYGIGDLVWFKIGCHPYWPSMISYDPHDGRYVKTTKVGNKDVKMYHVQYFGDKAQHGWVFPHLSFYFHGTTHYYNTKVKLMEEFGYSRKKRMWIRSQFDIREGIFNRWRAAAFAAEIAFLWPDVQFRYNIFVFKYETVTNKPALTNGTTPKRHRKRKKTTKKQPQVVKPTTIDKFCSSCQKGGGEITCTGTCRLSFHKECLGLLIAPESFICMNCDKDLDSCLVCKKTQPSLTKCKICTYLFHDECIKKSPCANFEKRNCPLHACLTCHTENRSNISSKGSFVQCAKCPTVFHASNKCIPVGSVLMSPTILYCPEHYLGKNRESPIPVFNVSYCARCNDGGVLVCCEACPNAYHRHCLDRAVPEGDFFCDDCLQRKYLYFNMVVWAKIGNFRFWPAKIMDPEEAPDNVKSNQKHNGEFLIKYFGSADYSWTHRGRVIPYIEEHKKHEFRPDFKQCKLSADFQLSLTEAAGAYDEYVLERENMMSTSKPDTYKQIKVNHVVPPAQIIDDAESIYRCVCDPDGTKPCSTDECMNRIMLIECHPDVCPVGVQCKNQRFAKRQYASVKVIKTKKRGWGLQSNEFIRAGSFVIEYVGEVISTEEYHRRSSQMQENNLKNYYFLYLDNKRIIDAGPKGNYARFINHSCNPNCEMQKWTVNGDFRIGIFAIADIMPGTEITFNYHSEKIKFHQKCYCGSDKCVGYIGRNGEKERGKIKSN